MQYAEIMDNYLHREGLQNSLSEKWNGLSILMMIRIVIRIISVTVETQNSILSLIGQTAATSSQNRWNFCKPETTVDITMKLPES